MENYEGPERYICFKLNRVSRKIYRYYESKLASFNVTPSQFYVLSVLWKYDGLKFKDLALKLSMDGATLTGILDRMDKRGFIEKRDDPDDRRSIRIFLTQESKELEPDLINIANNLDKNLRSDVSEDEFELFLQIIDKL